MTSLSKVRWIVKLEQLNTRVAFDSYTSFETYVNDLKKKHIEHKIEIEYNET